MEDIRVTLHHLTELNLIAARRVFFALRKAGLEPGQARQAVERCARAAWQQDRDFVDVLAGDEVVSAHLSREQIGALADEVRQESEAAARQVEEELDAIETLNHPLDLRELGDDEIDTFDAVFVPGGHGPMVDLIDNDDVGYAIRSLHEQDRTVAALCHGPVALLSAGTLHGGTQGLPPPTGLRVVFLDVGQGDSTLLQVATGSVLVDEGPPEAHEIREDLRDRLVAIREG